MKTYICGEYTYGLDVGISWLTKFAQLTVESSIVCFVFLNLYHPVTREEAPVVLVCWAMSPRPLKRLPVPRFRLLFGFLSR